MNAHELAEERSLELHREIRRLIERDPALLERARERVRGWQADRLWTRYYEGVSLP